MFLCSLCTIGKLLASLTLCTVNGIRYDMRRVAPRRYQSDTPIRPSCDPFHQPLVNSHFLTRRRCCFYAASAGEGSWALVLCVVARCGMSESPASVITRRNARVSA